MGKHNRDPVLKRRDPTCRTCGGSGVVPTGGRRNPDITCPACNGRGTT